jgi:hypothetical protein
MMRGNTEMDKADTVAKQFSGGELERIEANRQGHVVAELTVLSFLIQHGIVTLEEVEKRFQEVCASLPQRYQDESVALRTGVSDECSR